MRARAFITQKEAESETDCQDRFSINPATGSVAVSDGMSQSLFPKYWAEILADRYAAERDWFPTRKNVQALAPLWMGKVRKRLEEWRALGREPWRSENMLATGVSAGATLVEELSNQWLSHTCRPSPLQSNMDIFDQLAEIASRW